MNKEKSNSRARDRVRKFTLLLCAMVVTLLCGVAIANPPDVDISDTPMGLVEPTHPQVLLVVPNSQSMDGDLSGAIMTGSGTASAFSGSSSPVNYTVPAGFTPPLDPGSGGQAPYTVPDGGKLKDNSASRLNVAKQAIQQVLQQYAANFDFGLMAYRTGTPTLYDTWVYYMSGDNGFEFSNSKSTTLPTGATKWINNPCKSGACTSGMTAQLGIGATSRNYMAIANSSDNPKINDVLYGRNLRQIFLSYGSRNPSNPYTHFSLSDYNDGNILVTYASCTPHACVQGTSPTNAGFVPSSKQVIYARRGFAYYVTTQSYTAGDLLVDVDYIHTAGDAPTASEIQNYINKFETHLQPETNNRNTKEIKAVGVQSPIATLVEWARKYYEDGVSGYPKPQSNTGCDCNKYVVMLTDGLPTQDLAGKVWPPLGTAAADGYGVHATFNLEDGGTISTTDAGFEAKVLDDETTTLASTNDQALQDAIDELQDLNDAEDKDDGIQAYIIGMGAGVDPTKNPAAAATMKAMALAGGTENYYPGTTPEKVAEYLQAIFARIQAANQTSTAVAVNSTSFQSNLAVYQALYDGASHSWSGDLVSYPVEAGGVVDRDNPNWHARAVMATQFAGAGWKSARQVVTVNDDTGKAVPFRWNKLSPDQQVDFQAHWNSLSSTEQGNFSNGSVEYGKAVLNYLRGDQTSEEDNGGIFRNRTYLLGDIVHSAPLYVGSPRAAFLGDGYAGFAADYTDRDPVIYAGANDGALHAFNAETGHELFAFYPLAVFSGLADLTLPAYNDSHRFFVDGSPSKGNVQFADASWHTVLAGGLNSGGQGLYALDITDPDDFASESSIADDVLWSITSSTAGFSHLGLTYSQPQIVRINCDDAVMAACNDSNTLTPVAIFGSGYNNDNGKPYLYVVNVETGELIRALDLCADDSTYCDSGLANGLSTPVTLSSTATNTTDRVYAGDLQGNLWRIDMASDDPGDWEAQVLFTARNGSGDIQPITTKPTVTRGSTGSDVALSGSIRYGIMVYFGTGRFLGQQDIQDTSTQTFYGVLDTRTDTDLHLIRDDLAKRTLHETTIAGVGALTVSGSDINWASQYGWRMDLLASGERAVTNPVVRNGRVIFTTFTPSSAMAGNEAMCEADGFSRLMVVNYATGGALDKPELDFNGDGKLDSSDQTSGGDNPIGMFLGKGFASAPSFVDADENAGDIGDYKLITMSGDIETVAERGGGNEYTGVRSWSQIR